MNSVKKKIDLIIIGAQKSGTTSLKNYLSKIPVICSHLMNEIDFFINDDIYRRGFEKVWDSYYKEEEFESSEFIIAKSVSILSSEKYIKRVKKHNPNCKIIIVLRNPIDRAYSSYWYARRFGWENITSFEEAIEAPVGRFKEGTVEYRNCNYLDAGLYAKHIKNVYKYFKRDQVHIYLLEELKTNTKGVVEEICHILGITSKINLDFQERYNEASLPRFSFITKLLYRRNNPLKFIKFFLGKRFVYRIRSYLTKLNEKTIDKPMLKPETKTLLRNYYRKHNNELSSLINKDLTCWNYDS